MAYPADVSSRLSAMGFVSGVDFRVENNGTQVIVQWLSAQAQPSEAAVNAVDMSAAAIDARENAKEPLLADLLAQATGAITANGTFIGIGSPTNAQVIAHVRALSQQNNRIIRGLFRVIQKTWRNGQTPP
jgi:hypothetical protein